MPWTVYGASRLEDDAAEKDLKHFDQHPRYGGDKQDGQEDAGYYFSFFSSLLTQLISAAFFVDLAKQCAHPRNGLFYRLPEFSNRS